MEISVELTEISVTYYYTDIFVITALNLEIITPRRKISPSIFTNFFGKIKDGNSDSKMRVPKSLFVKAKGPVQLLALMGLHSSDGYLWWDHLLTISEHSRHPQNDESNLAAPIAELRKHVEQSLTKLTDDL